MKASVMRWDAQLRHRDVARDVASMGHVEDMRRQ